MSDHEDPPHLREAMVAHEIAHAFSALGSTVASVREILSAPLSEIQSDDWAELREHVEVIAREVESQTFHALNVLGQYAPEIAAGFLRPQFQQTTPAEFLLDILPPYQRTAARRDISIQTEALRESDEMPRLWIEVNTLRRAFHNILTNALKYSYAGHRQQRFIRIWSRRHDPEGRLWALMFQNYGIGFTDEERSHLTEPGFRGAMAKAELTFGSGLGLTDVERCMFLHGGRLLLDSRPVHNGTYLTTVTLVFPRVTNIQQRMAHAVDSVA